MKFTNIFDKLKIVFDLVIKSDILTILVMLMVAILLLRLFNKINNKKTGIIMYIMEVIAFVVFFYNRKTQLATLANTVINNIFLNFYFPSVYVYLSIFAISTIIFIYILLNNFISKTYKIITNIYYITLNFILILLIDTIINNNIDVFAKESLFTNNNALILLELSTLLFIVYLIITGLIYITNYIIMSVGNKQIVTEKVDNKIEEKINVEINIDREKREKEVFVSEPLVSFNELVSRIENNKEEKINLVPEIDLNKITESFEENKKGFKFINPLIFEEAITNEEKINEIKKIDLNSIEIIKPINEEKITLNDYKLFSQMLKTVIANSNNNRLALSDILNRNILIKYSEEEYNKFKKILNSCLN